MNDTMDHCSAFQHQPISYCNDFMNQQPVQLDSTESAYKINSCSKPLETIAESTQIADDPPSHVPMDPFSIKLEDADPYSPHYSMTSNTSSTPSWASSTMQMEQMPPRYGPTDDIKSNFASFHPRQFSHGPETVFTSTSSSSSNNGVEHPYSMQAPYTFPLCVDSSPTSIPIMANPLFPSYSFLPPTNYPVPSFVQKFKRRFSASPAVPSSLSTNVRCHPRHQSANGAFGREELDPTFSTPSPLLLKTQTFSTSPVNVTSPTSTAPLEDSTIAQTDIGNTLSPNHLRFSVVLQAATAATQRSDETCMTYLNRGQAYAIDVADKHSRNEIITSTLILTFHDASHRKLANNYWTFWMTQQKNANRARALSLDVNRSIGVFNVVLSNFDRITFDWNGSQGAKIYIQFHCLSTDFSRIKGVKGIPLRVTMENRIFQSDASHNLSNPPCNLLSNATTTTTTDGSPTPTINNNNNNQGLVYIERCFCKIKLFRDKGAERKNKDDAKQINKQFEKLNNGNQRYHPKWIVYRKPQPYSVFSELPQWASSDLETVPLQLPSASSAVPLTNYPPRAHQRVMTAPTMSHGLPSSSDMSLLSTIPSVPPYTELGSTLTMTALPNFMAAKSTIGPTETQWMTTDRTPVLDANPQWPISPPLATGMKRSRTQYEENSAMTTKDPSPSTTGPLPTTHSIVRSFFVKTPQSKPARSPPTPLPGDTVSSLQRVELESLSIQEFTIKICGILALHPNQVSEVVWRRQNDKTKDADTSPPSKKTNHDVLVLVDDTVMSQHFSNNITMSVDWEVKSNGMVRVSLCF